ncbi:malto-oligosyltrehalose trehalohydrolase [Nitrobacter sp. NHB1]|uniref:malto-oligosyltrehalose trehalohydrolase n=1 Tax=Nitrobacter sp. NHB1 TaxID=3119830 RepID=UPI002FFF65D5
MSAGRFGPVLRPDGTTFRLWAPAADEVAVITDTAHTMAKDSDGWFIAEVAAARPGTRYHYRIDGSLNAPDPASSYQPDDVSGPSEVVDHSRFQWKAIDWRGRPWHETVILECHVGTFTPEGTYRAMIGKLDHLVSTGITALELMPVADFAGRRNWGYDGALWYAPDHVYGTPDDLRELIDQAHLRGLMVFLDVVYNHFGPEGNYLGRYAPQFFRSETLWGAAIDYRVPEVRAFAVDNALHWLGNYRFDGLRLDAVHALAEVGEPSILNDISRAVGVLARQSGRHIHLVLENDDNRAALLDPSSGIPEGKYRAQWNDDYHHVWHVILTQETHGYYGDYATQPRHLLARTLRGGFAYQGEPSAYRGGRARGERIGALPPAAFVNFLQNHDQIGNRALGDRLEWTADARAIEAALAITLLAPMPPLMFMGEEWGATTPFPFFCDFKGDLADAVRAGRRREYAEAYEAFGDDVPDPLAQSTFESAVLVWPEEDQHLPRHEFVKELLRIRRHELMPHLGSATFASAELRQNDRLLIAYWRLGNSALLHLRANISDHNVTNDVPPMPGRPIWGGEPPARLPAWSVFWSMGAI